MAMKRVYEQMATLSWVLNSHHVCNGKPPDKAVTFLLTSKTTHTNQENSALLCFNVDVKF